MASDPRLIEPPDDPAPTDVPPTEVPPTEDPPTEDPLPAPTAALGPTAALEPMTPPEPTAATEPTAALEPMTAPERTAALETPLAEAPRAETREADAPVDATGPTLASAGPASTARDADVVVAMRAVSRRFEDREVLSGIDLTVPRGTILGIIGPSGAGKTTTIRMLTGALKPTSGEVSVLGRSPAAFRRSEREKIGYMPQSFTLYEDLTAGENIDFVASLFGMLWRRRRRRVNEVLKVVDLWDARGRQAGRLSGGMQRRLELACALVHEPELIILDEPTAGIDPLLRGSIWEHLHALRDAGRTLLVTTQHVSEADECDAVAMIVGGRIIALATPDELRRLATNGDLLDIETSAMFDGNELLGTPGVTEVRQDGPRHLQVVVEDAGSSLPDVVERIKAVGGGVESAREQRLSFDEIFAILVARDNDERAAEEAAAADAPAADPKGAAA